MFFIVVDIGYVRAMLGAQKIEWHVDCLRGRFPNARIICFDGAPGRLARGAQTRIAQRAGAKLCVGDLDDEGQIGVDEMICRRLDLIAREAKSNHVLLVSGDKDFADSFRRIKCADKTVSLVAIQRGQAVNQSRRLRSCADRIWTFAASGRFEVAAN